MQSPTLSSTQFRGSRRGHRGRRAGAIREPGAGGPRAEGHLPGAARRAGRPAPDVREQPGAGEAERVPREHREDRPGTRGDDGRPRHLLTPTLPPTYGAPVLAYRTSHFEPFGVTFG